MFEAVLLNAKLLKSVIEAIKDIISEANFEISSSGIELQAMDSAHVALVALRLDSEGFEHFRCDRTFSLGTLSLAALLTLGRFCENVYHISVRVDKGQQHMTTAQPSSQVCP